jgi:hypothetical protein
VRAGDVILAILADNADASIAVLEALHLVFTDIDMLAR